MKEQRYEEEAYDYNEGLLVVDGRLLLQVEQETVAVEISLMYLALALALAGTEHAI